MPPLVLRKFCVSSLTREGSGGLLLKAYKKVLSGKVAIYGQELNAQTWALCTMNMFLHGVDDARIWQGDTLSNPQNIENDKLMKFQVVVANERELLGLIA